MSCDASTNFEGTMTEPFRSSFLYVSCQHGAEKVLKQAFCEPSGTFRLAYSGKGLLTFKIAFPVPAWTRALLEHPLVRSRGVVLGRVEGDQSSPMVDTILKDYQALDWDALHVWQRDIAQPGWNGFEPGQSMLAVAVAELLRQRLRLSGDLRPVLALGLDPESDPSNPSTSTPTSPQPTPKPRASKVLDVILDEPQRWWIAARDSQQRYDGWPGGIPDLYAPEQVISRAYFKLAEAFAWSGLKLRPGERVVEIGASPGGACQWLLDSGAIVTGIDPADMNASLLTHPNFTHWRARSLQVKRRAFRDFRILVCDANVAPKYTLDTVEAIVTYPTSRFRALVLTIKMPEWDVANLIPEHVERVRSWGFEHVEARQLAHNRREYCLVARGRIRSLPSDPQPLPPADDASPTPANDAIPPDAPSNDPPAIGENDATSPLPET